MSKVFSGIQPTGALHIGNYLGAIKNWVKMQNDFECLFCLVDLHAITVAQNPEDLRTSVLRNFAYYIACGLDQNKSILFAQSSVPEHSELGWILGCQTPLGWLNRMTQFKDKAGKDRESAMLGLYSYPVLMAADILLYHATHVPVGEDQTQHLELARDIAGAFNRNFNVDFFKEPTAIKNKIAARVMSLRDGTKKMSKSEESDFSRINMNDDADLIMQKFKKAKSDAIAGISYDREARPEISNLLEIYSSFAEVSIEQAVTLFENEQTSKFKQAVAEMVIDKLQPIQVKANQLMNDKGELLKEMNRGAEKAREIASKTIKDVKNIVGFI